MWYLHNRQIQALKVYTDSNISIILKKINIINKNQDEIFIILKDIDLIINIKNKPDHDDKVDDEEEEDHQHEEDEYENQEDDDSSSDYQP
jgi:ABC-type Zn2+ transport system substrate-binding protein/surface adhesin